MKPTIRIVVEGPGKVLTAGLADQFRNALRASYEKYRIEIRLRPSRSAVGYDMIEEAHDVASLAEDAQRQSRARLTAYLRPIGWILKSEKTGRTDAVKAVLIAVAHRRGIGTFIMARASSITMLPTPALQKLLDVCGEVEAVMRPRTSYKENAATRALGTRLREIVEDTAKRGNL